MLKLIVRISLVTAFAWFLFSCGDDGLSGLDGTPGTSCSVSRLADGALIVCSDGSSAVVYDGKNGKDGKCDKGNHGNPHD